ncbi:Werner Syndrome-like exonuclease [Morus notabilis]|uniref:Werner Syndrome-like exonuclease n=1 Tax=Morus notabilis TaxID=981085 RepID=W9SHV7_9ROSA|nr:Werner Syndrome-like exonuclease [Morus notabilis]EXC30709.1 Werner Syndrome-like exonuclease [Morus notabilis]
MAVVTIHDHELDSDIHNLYDVVIYSKQVKTLLTTCPSMVSSWISDVEKIHRRRLSRLIVGLDVEWRPSFSRYQNPVATLQICVGHRCLIFQLIHADSIPASLSDFLANANYSFVGVGIGADIEKLAEDHGLTVRNAVDLGDLAAREYDDPGMKNRGLKDLARIVRGMEIEKPKRITMGRWDNRWLTCEQVQYACVDAFVSFEIGKKLITGA